MIGTAIGFGLYLLLLAGLAIRAAGTAGRSDADYFLAGRTLGPWVVGLSAVASGRSSWLLLAVSGVAWADGVAAVWFLPGYILAELIMFLGPGRRLRRFTGRMEDVTVGDFLASRHPRWAVPLRALFAAGVILFLTAYISGQLVAGAKSLSASFDLPSEMGSVETARSVALWATAVIVLLYVVLGGFRAVSWTDVAQVAVMLVGLVGLPALAIHRTGGLGELFEQLGAQGLLDPFSQGGAFVLTGLAIGLGSPGNPHILVRYMSVSDERQLRRAAMIGTTWNVVLGWGAIWVGLAARVALSGITDGETVFPRLAETYFPAFLQGLVIAAILAAIMSTVDSQVLVISSAWTRDLPRVFGRRGLSDRAAAWIGRIVSAVVLIIAGLLAQSSLESGAQETETAIQGLVNQLVLFAWGGLGAALGPAILLALYDPRANGMSAFGAMLVGGATACLWKEGTLKELVIDWGLPESWMAWIGYELTVAFPLALVVGMVLARIGRRAGA